MLPPSAGPIVQAPPKFPRSDSDLPAWNVYADQLLSSGDRLGELLAVELALPRVPSRDALAAFHAQAHRFCHTSRWLDVGWCLGHARSLAVRQEYPHETTNRAIAWVPEGALAVARDFLRTPQGQTVERFAAHVPLDTVRNDPWWHRVMAELPACCDEMALGLPDMVDRDGAGAILEALPSSVRTLALWHPRPGLAQVGPELFVDDRLAWLDLTWWTPTPEGLERLFQALGRTSRMRVRLPSLGSPVPPGLESRLWLGEAGFLGQEGGACGLSRWPLRLLQRHHGIVSVHAQLHRLLAEPYDLDHPAAGRLAASFKEGNALVRHGTGVWTARSSYSLPLAKNGTALAPGALPVPLVDGDVLRIGQDPTSWRFNSRGLDSAFRRQWAVDARLDRSA